MLDELLSPPAETRQPGHAPSARSNRQPIAYVGPERRHATSAMAHWLTLMLDEMDHGLLLVDAAGGLRHANQLGWQALQDGDCLRATQGQVHPRHAEELPAYLAALVGACTGRRRMLNLSRENGVMPVAFVPMPVPEDERLAMLVLGKRHRCEALTLDFFARTHSLTAAETKVLCGLCEGLRPKEVAREAGVAVSTVRSQISSIRTKTQTASIGDLLNRVAVLPPITPAMKTGLSH
jgi:DNA-binding CsgD family transcriptional regulator